MAVIPTADNDWGVTVEEVSALAPHVTIGEAPATPVDDVFDIPADRKVTVNEVESWIRDVAGRVSLRLSDLSRVTDAGRVGVVGKSAHDAVVNGAASYLVAAAFPAGSANSDGGYAALLWSRYESALSGVGSMLDAWLVEIAANPTPGAVSGFFPATSFPDAVKF